MGFYNSVGRVVCSAQTCACIESQTVDLDHPELHREAETCGQPWTQILYILKKKEAVT